MISNLSGMQSLVKQTCDLATDISSDVTVDSNIRRQLGKHGEDTKQDFDKLIHNLKLNKMRYYI